MSEWQPIETAPMRGDVILAAYIIPSAYAQENGSKPYWTYGFGQRMLSGKWTGILGGTPSHWMPMFTPPPTSEERG